MRRLAPACAFLALLALGCSKRGPQFGVLPGVVEVDKELASRLGAAWDTRTDGYEPRTRHLHDNGSPKYTNRLFLESSPYLRQHAHNPVNWYPWGPEAFAAAKARNVPVLLSVGYSTCHWCHVMEEESFEDVEIAQYMNENYVAIKVDREERPDVDDIYMTAVRALTGGGGWPMTVWLTADRQPFYGRTYIPARDGDRGAPQGFLTLLQYMKKLHVDSPTKITSTASQLALHVQKSLNPEFRSPDLPGSATLHGAARYYRENFDAVWGGTKKSPKFPSTMSVRMLLRHHRRTKNEESLKMAAFTLEKMAAGGMYDQVGGGFHRYSTDERWLVPHFEKMLYDNALLTMAYLEGYQVTRRDDFARTAHEILRYVGRDMTSPEGAFYSATDADSLNPEGHREEGWFFTWTPVEIETLLGKERAADVIGHYGVTSNGNFEGRSILHVVKVATDPAVRKALDASLAQMYVARKTRPPPLRDDKILTAWNGLMISAFAQASVVFNEPEYAATAERAAAFILENMRDGQRLKRTYMAGAGARYNAYLDDYAFLTAGVLDLYEATGNVRWLKEAIDLDAVVALQYEDLKGGGFFLTSHDHEQLLARQKPSYDGAEPTGNSIHLSNLLRLHELTTNDMYRVRSEKTMQAFGQILERAPAALSEMLLAVDFYLDKPKEIVIITAGDGRAGAAPFLAKMRGVFLPNKVVLVTAEGAALDTLSGLSPLVRQKTARGESAAVYVCERGVCEAPTTDPEVFAKQIAKTEPLPGES